MKIFGEKKALFALFVIAAFMSALFCGVADFSPKKNILIVNSNNYEDVITGAVYAQQNGYTYTFILTPSHGKYWDELLENSNDNVEYYQSSSPVFAAMEGKLREYSKPNIKIHSTENLSGYFAQKNDFDSAIIVGSQIGAEAVSVAPYAVVSNSSLYFSDKQSADALVSALLEQNKKVLVYGTITDSISEQNAGSVESINEGSIYLDNLKILDMYSDLTSANQVLLSSGKTFEADVVSSKYPVAIVGRTEPAEGLYSWILDSGVKNALVFSGDADITGSVASIKKQTGLPVFIKLGQGFDGDSKMQPLAVMPIPSKDVVLTVSSVSYNGSGYELNVANDGHDTAYVRASVSLPSGKIGSTQSIKIASGQSTELFVPLKTQDYSTATFHVYSGCDKYVVESIDEIVFSDIKGSSDSSLSLVTTYTNSPDVATYANEQGGMFLSYSIALVLLLVAAYLFVHHSKRGSHVVLAKGSHRRKKHRGRK